MACCLKCVSNRRRGRVRVVLCSRYDLFGEGAQFDLCVGFQKEADVLWEIRVYDQSGGNAADLDEALAWAGKVAEATNHPIEVRPFRATGRVADHMPGA